MNRVIILPYDKYMRLKKREECRPESRENEENRQAVIEENEIIDKVPEKNMDIDSVLIGIPKRFRSRAKSILQYIIQKTSIEWNEKGEISIDRKHIPFSNMNDLVKDALFPYKHFIPIGKEEFYSELRDIPLSLIQNANRRKEIQEGRGQMDRPKGPPPPGIPDTRNKISLYKKEVPAPMSHKEIASPRGWKELWSPLQ
jgi:hypothetical protein